VIISLQQGTGNWESPKLPTIIINAFIVPPGENQPEPGTGRGNDAGTV
jgi:hypothetical protein